MQRLTYYCVDVLDLSIDSLGVRFIVACEDEQAARDHVHHNINDPKSDLFLEGEPVLMDIQLGSRTEVRAATLGDIRTWGMINPTLDWIRS